MEFTRLEDPLIHWAVESPESEAVSVDERSYTYADLDSMTTRAEELLSNVGVAEGSLVVLWVERTVELLAVMQGTLRLGGAYVPIDESSPPERVNEILKQCGESVLCTSRSLLASVPSQRLDMLLGGLDAVVMLDDVDLEGPPTERGPQLRRSAQQSAEACAFVLFTSGSTGTPKGVRISHSNALAFVHWAVKEFRLAPSDRLLNIASAQFDLSVLDYYGALCSGASVHILPSRYRLSGHAMRSFVLEHRITVLYSVPSTFTTISASGGDWATGSCLRLALFAGEPFPVVKLRPIRETWRGIEFYNLYGPTETNVCTAYRLPEFETWPAAIPIGSACVGRVWAERSDGSSALVGETGELCVDGPSVMLGYLGYPDHVGPYRTGDEVLHTREGIYTFLGRRDSQVKVHGYRIELEEIEAILSRLDGVLEIAVVAWGELESARLVACLVASAPGPPSLVEMKRALAKQLPTYMTIDSITQIPAMPRTTNGKVDRRSLQLVVRADQEGS